MKILLLDDDADIHLYFEKKIFQNLQDYDVWYAYNREDVFSYINDNGQPDVCIFDIMLGNEKSGSRYVEDGISIAAELLKKNKNLPIFFLTQSLSDDGYFNRMLQLGIPPHNFLGKDTKNGELIPNVKQFLELLDRAVRESVDDLRYLSLVNHKIGIPTKYKTVETKNGVQEHPILFTYFNKDEILYLVGRRGRCEIFTINEDNPFTVKTTATRIIKQLTPIYNCFIECGNVAINIERIKIIDVDNKRLYFDNTKRTKMDLPDDFLKKTNRLITKPE
jgi:CheY-like chemotaxis protein